jgi:hypothetical protein
VRGFTKEVAESGARSSMQLAEFILNKIEAIAREWEELAKTCTPAAIGMT